MKRIDKKSLEKIGLVAAGIGVLILIIVFFIRPTIIGYTTYRQLVDSDTSIDDYGKNIQELESDLLNYKANLSACNLFSEKISEEFDKSSKQFTGCLEELNDLRVDFNVSLNEMEDRVDDLNNELEDKNNEVEDLESDYDKLAKNLANNLCCKKKVDNPDINSYIVENNNIVCVEEGGIEIEC